VRVFPWLLLMLLIEPGAASAAPPAGRLKLQRGDEFTYAGTIAEAVDRPGIRFRRTHLLTLRIFVLERKEMWADAAVLALVRRTDDAPVSGVLPDVTGTKRDDRSPPAARLDLVRIHADGTVHRLAPLGPAPLRFAADTPALALPTPPLDSFAPFEFGPLAPRSRAGDDSWTLAGHDFIQSERCVHLSRIEHAPDWNHPRGGQVSWHRAEDAWLADCGVARKFTRSIRQRDGIATEPSVRVDVSLELQEQGRPIGRMYERYRADIEAAYLSTTELGPLMKDAAKHGPEPFKQRIARLDSHLETTHPGSPFREAVLAVRRQLDAARRGEPVFIQAEAAGAIAPKVATMGQLAPEFCPAFPLAAQAAPTVLVFFMPGQETAAPSLVIADALSKKFGAKVRVAAFTVFAPASAGTRDRDRLKLAVPIYDGSAAEESYGIATFPRFFVLDAAGTLKWSLAGVGNETGFLVREQVEGLLASPVVTGSPAGSGAVRPTVKP